MQLAGAARRAELGEIAEITHRIELIARLEREVRANVNLKHAFANLVAQWSGA
jgi:hypothetical protein